MRKAIFPHRRKKYGIYALTAKNMRVAILETCTLPLRKTPTYS
jgi:hypothetical protein